MAEKQKNTNKEDIDLVKVFRIINKHKWILLGIFSVFVILAVLYNTFSKPIYESKVVLKKEKTEKPNTADELQRIISLQSPDEIETELELVKTNEVLIGVIKELDLFASIQSVKTNYGVDNLNMGIVDYRGKFSNNLNYPQFYNIDLSGNNGYNVILRKENNGFKLIDFDTHRIIVQADTADTVNINTLDLKMSFSWNKAETGNEVQLKLDDLYSTLKKLNSNVNVEQKAKTDVFEISVKSGTAYSAKIITDVLTDRFRMARIEQQKQTIKYSFNFVDKNLDDIKLKLEEAEANLSQYKSANQVMDVQGSSQDIVSFLSNLEAEKLNNELQLSDYRNKYSEMKGELTKKGFFDQTFLAPQGNEPTNSPFSNLMNQLSSLELQKLQLLEKRKDTHPDVIAINKQISQVKKDLNNYNQNTITSYRIIIGSLEEKANKIRQMLGKYQGKMSTLPVQESKLAALERQKAVYSKMYTLLLDKREEMRMAELSKLQDIVIVDAPRLPVEPIQPRKIFNYAIAGVLGIFFGFIGIFVNEFKNKKLVSLDEIENDFKLQIFAIIPSYSKSVEKKIEKSTSFEDKFVTLMEQQEGLKESFRVLRTKLLNYFDQKSKIVMFTSCEEHTGKTTVIANLAISLAQARKRVLLIDCDLKRATLSEMFDISEDVPGLISYLKRKVAQPYIYNKAVPTLDVLPSGGISENSGDLLGTDRMRNLFNIINASSYDYILIDTPPITRVVDTLVLGKLVKDIVLVIRPDHTFKESVEWGLEELKNENINVWGTVINAADIEKSSFKYKYGYGYGYGYNSHYGRNELSDDSAPIKATAG